jgi:hypothetical protein
VFNRLNPYVRELNLSAIAKSPSLKVDKSHKSLNFSEDLLDHDLSKLDTKFLIQDKSDSIFAIMETFDKT